MQAQWQWDSVFRSGGKEGCKTNGSGLDFKPTWRVCVSRARATASQRMAHLDLEQKVDSARHLLRFVHIFTCSHCHIYSYLLSRQESIYRTTWNPENISCEFLWCNESKSTANSDCVFQVPTSMVQCIGHDKLIFSQTSVYQAYPTYAYVLLTLTVLNESKQKFLGTHLSSSKRLCH